MLLPYPAACGGVVDLKFKITRFVDTMQEVCALINYVILLQRYSDTNQDVRGICKFYRYYIAIFIGKLYSYQN
jgi:hypothetical protein